MYKFSDRSLKRLNSCHSYLKLIMNELIKIYDVTILEGHRGEKKQNDLYHGGKSKLTYPFSKHNKNPSLAIDVAPYYKKKPHINWQDTKSFYYMIGLIKGIASQLHIKIRSGSDWNQDNDFDDNTFQDLSHIELDLS